MKRQSIEALGGIELTDRELAPDGMYAGLMPMESAGVALRGIATEMAKSFVEDMSQPAPRAGFVSSLLTSALLSRRLGFLPTVVIAVMVGVSVEHLYAMAEDIHGTLTGTSKPDWVFHAVFACPGHVSGTDAALSEECPDAPEPV